MKKFLLGTVGLLALSMAAPASAADMAARPYTKAPPPMMAPVFDWSGFYIGANGGAGSSRKCWDSVAPNLVIGAEGCHDATGATAGGQLGYRWQASSWVFGLEAQGNWADFRGSNTSLVFAPEINRSRIDAFGLFTGQIGYAWNNVLLYAKGGAAVTADKYSVVSPANVLFGSAKETRWGAAVGGGLEFGFAQNWSIGVEYDHLFMDTHNNTFTAPGGLAFATERIRQDVDIGLVRRNYRFGGWGGGTPPVAARY
jgi:outer membrane immunogenic protein